MLRDILASLLSEQQRRALKAQVRRIRTRVTKRLFSYGKRDLHAALRKMGVAEGDTVMVHANFEADSGFDGVPMDLIETLVDLLGKNGNLMMVSIPFRGSAYDHLQQKKTFYVKRTVSLMGLVTELFRRRHGTVRSLHPTHPVLACGKDSVWIVADHHKCVFPCGVGTPFDKLLQLKGKILFYDVGFGAITFFHYVEDLLKTKLPFAVYNDRRFEATVVDENEAKHVVHTYAFTKGVIRDTEKVKREMVRQNKLEERKVGNSTLILVNAEDVVAVMTKLVQSGDHPYIISTSVE
jgi:aminoglycoside 3-N-acetyltransferase